MTTDVAEKPADKAEKAADKAEKAAGSEESAAEPAAKAAEPAEKPAGPETKAAEVRKKAVRGAAWTVVLSLTARILQVIGTLALTYLLSKDVVGEATNAAIFALNAHMFTTLGIPNWLVVKDVDPRRAFHATFLLTTSGVLALAVAILLVGPSSKLLQSPNLAQYLVPLAIATLLARIAVVPERLLQYRLRFRDAGVAKAASELSFSVFTLGPAYLGAGGWSIVYGNLARGLVALVGMSLLVHPREWAKPYPLDRSIFRDILGFGLPIGIALWLGFASRNLDNFVVSALFGTAVVGAYNLAYNLADVPASQIGEQLGDVITPTFARLDGDARKAALPRALAVLSLIVFPLGVGLGATAETVATTFLRKEWHAVGGLLAVLAILSVTRPVAWVLNAFMQVTNRNRTVMWLTAFRLIAVMVSVAGLGVLFQRFGMGPIGSSLGVGVAFSLYTLGCVVVLMRDDGFGFWALMGGTLRALAACVPLVLAVYGARLGLAAAGVSTRGVNLGIEVIAGGLGYGVGVLLFARPQAKETIRLLKDLRRDRKK